MGVLNDLIVKGASRFIGDIYSNNIENSTLTTSNIYIYGTQPSDKTSRRINSDSLNNIYFAIQNPDTSTMQTPMTITHDIVRPGSAHGGQIDLGSSSTRWKDAYATTFRTYDSANTSGTDHGFLVNDTSGAKYAAMYFHTAGTASTVGQGALSLGNNVASGTAKNARGTIFIYGTNTSYTRLMSNLNATSSSTVYLPNKTGDSYLAHVSSTAAVGDATKPVYVAADGRITIGNQAFGVFNETSVNLTNTNPTPGTYKFLDTHPVTGVTEYGSIITLAKSTAAGNAGYDAQLLISSASGSAQHHMYIRRLTSTPTWLSWTKVLTEDDVAAKTTSLSFGSTSIIATINDNDIKVTMPANPNTDTKVTQGVSTTGNWRKILLGAQNTSTKNADVSAQTNTAYVTTSIEAQANTGYIGTTGYYLYDDTAAYGNFKRATKGTATTIGSAQMTVGNATAANNADNAHGVVYLYADTTKYSGILSTLDIAGHQINYLPKYNTGTSTYYGKLVGIYKGTTAGSDGFSDVGSSTRPVYVTANGVVTAGSTYAGGTALTLNGTSKAGSTASAYAPTSAGTSEQVLTSAGSGAPSWANQSSLTGVANALFTSHYASSAASTNYWFTTDITASSTGTTWVRGIFHGSKGTGSPAFAIITASFVKINGSDPLDSNSSYNLKYWDPLGLFTAVNAAFDENRKIYFSFKYSTRYSRVEAKISYDATATNRISSISTTAPTVAAVFGGTKIT